MSWHNGDAQGSQARAPHENPPIYRLTLHIAPSIANDGEMGLDTGNSAKKDGVFQAPASRGLESRKSLFFLVKKSLIHRFFMGKPLHQPINRRIIWVYVVR
jgi:hypothetical protein